MLRSRRHVIGRTFRRKGARISAPMNPSAHQTSAKQEPLRFDASTLIGPLAASLQGLYNAIPVALGVIGRDGRYLAVNRAYALIHHLTPDDMMGSAVADYLPMAGEQLREDFQRFDMGIANIEREVACHGSYYQAILQPVHDGKGSVQGVTVVLVDITSRKQTEQALERARRQWQFRASHDYLTGLPNRRQLDDAILAEVSRCLRTGTPLSVLMMDVDYFKKFNDHVGHQRGDECLRAIAVQLQKRMRRHSDLVGRYGGEEFIAILPGTDSVGAYLVAQGVLEDVRTLGIAHSSSPYGCVTLSIGVATLRDMAGQVAKHCDLLLDHADRALYSAKAAGRNTVCIYPPH